MGLVEVIQASGVVELQCGTFIVILSSAFAQNYGHCSSFAAEVKSVLFQINLCLDMGISALEIESDSRILLECLSNVNLLVILLFFCLVNLILVLLITLFLCKVCYRVQIIELPSDSGKVIPLQIILANYPCLAKGSINLITQLFTRGSVDCLNFFLFYFSGYGLGGSLRLLWLWLRSELRLLHFPLICPLFFSYIDKIFPHAVEV